MILEVIADIDITNSRTSYSILIWIIFMIHCYMYTSNNHFCLLYLSCYICHIMCT